MKTSNEILLELIFPRFARPSRSRFISKSLQQIQARKTLIISTDKISRGEDKRTSILIKNLPEGLSKEYLCNILMQAGNVNYLYLPFDKKRNKFLGFAFVNLVNYKSILGVYELLNGKKLVHFPSEKSIELCYSKVQGKTELIKMFSTKYDRRSQ